MLNFQFRSRSEGRDRESDRERLMRIHQTVRSAVTDAERELDEFRGRLEKARQSAAMLLGNTETPDHDQAYESKLTLLEGRLLVAEKRIVQLKDHLAALQRIESAVNRELNRECDRSECPDRPLQRNRRQ
jgi:hypothetical protein